MARQVHRLDPKDIEKHLEPGRYPDGAGLYLQVGPNGNKSWLLRFMRDGRAREMGLCPPSPSCSRRSPARFPSRRISRW